VVTLHEIAPLCCTILYKAAVPLYEILMDSKFSAERIREALDSEIL
jgi:hypothetical protein